MVRVAILALLLAALVHGGVRAEPVIRAEPDPAVGRVNHAAYARKRHCTVFAIAPRVAVTATHCLAGIDAARTDLLFGYARMEWSRHLSPHAARDLGNDVAVLCLAEEAPATLPVAAEAPAREAPVTVAGYGRPRRHVQSESACAVIATAGAEILIDCPQSPGASGGPVMNAAGEVVGVMSRTGRASSVASRLPPDAAAACE